MSATKLHHWLLLASLAFGVCSTHTMAQPPTTPSDAMTTTTDPAAVPAPPPPTISEASPHDDALEAYLESLGLGNLRAEFLLERVGRAPREQRVAIAERLARLYVDLLNKATTPAERESLERRANDLLSLVPEADGFELRINLAKALYLRAEESIERARMKLRDTDAPQAQATLAGIEPQFRDIATRLHQRVEQLERKELAGDDSPETTAELAEARRLRSLAYYYAGWCQYYIALASGNPQPALDALKSFGWLLGSPGSRAASVDKLQTNLLKYEHVARAALGCALAAGLRGNDVEALRWLDAVEQTEDIPAGVREQLLSRRIIVLAGARRWADLELLLRRARASDRSGTGPNVQPLTVWNARLLAVVTLDADKSISGDTIEALGRIALGDLVARGEAGHVLDLVEQFGTTPMGDKGFIVHFVRGLKSYDLARDAHRALPATGSTPVDPDEPTSVSQIVSDYRAAARLLEAAISQPDATQFKADRARACVTLGRARFFAGDMLDAADAFRQGFDLYGTGNPQGEEALWLTIIALERAGKGERAGSATDSAATQSTLAKRDQTIALFLQAFPDSERAGRLLLMQISAGVYSADDAVRVLSGVKNDSPLYPAARRQLVKLLYDRVRATASSGAEREVATLKFLQVADEVMAIDRKAVTDTSQPDQQQLAAQRAIVLGRQMLDALLSGATPDAVRARSVLDTIEAVAEHQRVSLSPHAAELAFRRLQIALALDDAKSIDDNLSVIRAMGESAGSFADASDRVVYRASLQRWRAAMVAKDSSLDLARRVVQAGVRVLDRAGPGPDALKDPAMLGVASSVAEAAFHAWQQSGDNTMRDTSVSLDERVLQVRPSALDSLVRLSQSCESAGKLDRAAECWNFRLSAAPTGAPEWFEARWNFLRLLAQLDRAKARAQMDQHKALYPDYGPEPFGSQLRELDLQIGQAVLPFSPSPGDDTTGSTTP